jgi:aldehyde:ferredoxin oxidoreductase
MNNVIEVDISTRMVKVKEIEEDLIREHIGGSGLGVRILWDREAYRDRS